MAKPKLSYEQARSEAERAKFFGERSQSPPPVLGNLGDYSAVTSGIGKNRRYDADAEEELDRIAKKLDQAANAAPVNAGGQGQGAGGNAGGDLANKPKGDDPNKKEKPDGIKGDVDDDDGQVGAVGPDGKTSGPIEVPLETMEGYTMGINPMQIPLAGPAAIPGIATVSKLLMDQFNKSKKNKEADELMKKLYPNMGQPDRFNNL
tara:strand:+ start:821 stop:1435 length:615 start_codon:yes stop_codon:yes gene_type:complete